MADFSKQIADFKNYGVYNYLFDEAGNEILNASSSIFQQHFVSFPLITMNYDDSKIRSFYNVVLTEFVPPQPTVNNISSLPQKVIDQISEMTQTNKILSNQLDDMIAKSELVSKNANVQLMKDTILSLRIKLGQGTTNRDFLNEFPYLPMSVDQRDVDTI